MQLINVTGLDRNSGERSGEIRGVAVPCRKCFLKERPGVRSMNPKKYDTTKPRG
jgi:hypothetical protein